MELDDQRMKERIKTSQGVRGWQVNTTMTLHVDIFGIMYSYIFSLYIIYYILILVGITIPLYWLLTLVHTLKSTQILH